MYTGAQEGDDGRREGSDNFTAPLGGELYGKLKAHADAHGESVSDVVRRAIEALIQADAEPAPPPFSPPAEVPSEVAGLRGELEAVACRGEEARRYVEGVAWRLNELQGTVNKVLALLTPHLPPPPPVPFPGFPAPPWVGLAADRQALSAEGSRFVWNPGDVKIIKKGDDNATGDDADG